MNERYYFISYTFSNSENSGVCSTNIKVKNGRVGTSQVCNYIKDGYGYHNVVINNFIEITKEQFEDGIF